MSTSLNFDLFGNVLHRKQKSQRRISDSQIIYNGALCDSIMSGTNFVLTKQLQRRRWMNRRAASVCYDFQFPWWNWKHGGEWRPRGLKHFTYWYLLSFLGTMNIIYCFHMVMKQFVRNIVLFKMILVTTLTNLKTFSYWWSAIIKLDSSAPLWKESIGHFL